MVIVGAVLVCKVIGFFIPETTMLTPVSASIAVPTVMISTLVENVAVESALPLEYAAALKS